jgi:hypothetical protein
MEAIMNKLDFDECLMAFYDFDKSKPGQSRDYVLKLVEQVEACRQVIQSEISVDMQKLFVAYHANIETKIWQLAQLNDYLASYAYYLAYTINGIKETTEMTLQEVLSKHEAGTLANESDASLEEAKLMVSEFSQALKKHENQTFRITSSSREIPTAQLDKLSDSISTILNTRYGCND